VGEVRVLALSRRSSARPFAEYLGEILAAEGLLCVERSDRLDDLECYSAVVAYAELSEGEWEALKAYVEGGGRLVFIRPPPSRAELFGLRPLGARLSDVRPAPKYLRVDSSRLLGGLADRAVQVPSDGDLYEVVDGEVVARISLSLRGEGAYPAIVVRRVGDGLAAAYTYDLVEAVVTLRQGRRELAGVDADGSGVVKPNDMFIGLLDPRLRWVPQADVHMRTLSRLLERVLGPSKPLPRLWYFPEGSECVVVMTGDSDVMTEEDLKRLLSILSEYGAHYTLYVRAEEHGVVPSGSVGELRTRGLSLGPHTFPGFAPSPEEARRAVSEQVRRHCEAYGGGLTHRGHCTVWVGWVEMAKILEECGVKMDLSYYPYRYFQCGYLNGSGLPMRFIDERGEMVDVYEQSTHWADDVALVDKTFVDPYDLSELIEDAVRTIEESRRLYHTALTFCIHPVNMRPDVLNSAVWLRAVLSYCRSEGIPVLSADEWLEFNERRRRVRAVSYSVSSSELRLVLEAEEPVKGVAVAFPVRGSSVASVAVDGGEASYAVKELLGSEYLVVVLDISRRAAIRVGLRRLTDRRTAPH